MNKKYLQDFITEDEFQKFLYYMPNPDLTLQNNGETLKIIDNMLTDGHIFAKLEELKSGVLTKNWSIEPASQDNRDIEIADFVKKTIDENLDLDNDLGELLTALEYGFSVSEIVWKIDKNGFYIPDSLKGRSQIRFAFNGKEQLINLSDMKILDMPYKFIIFRNTVINENPYGQSLLTKCYWPYKFKKAGFKFWMTLLDKFGIPSIAALFKNGDYDSESKIKEVTALISEELAKIDSGSSAAFGNVDDIRILQGNGDGNSFERLILLCNDEMSKSITGSSLTSDTGSQGNGSFALAKLHAETVDKRISKINNKLQNTLNKTLIKDIVELNYGINIIPPTFQFEYSSLPEWEVLRDAIDRGIPVSKKSLYSKYNIPEPNPDDPDDVFIKQVTNQPPLNFSDFFFQNPKRFKVK